MSPRTSEQFKRLRQDKKSLIMEAALELFAERGFHGSSISQIAKKAGISKGLTYNYFESKNEILEEIIDHGLHEIQSLFDPNHDGILTEEEFISFINKSFDIVKNNLRHWKLFFSLMLQPIVSESFMSKYLKVGEPTFKMMYDFIAGKGSKDPEGDLMIISAMIEGAFLYAIVAPEIFPIDVMKEKINDGISRIIHLNN